MKRFTVIFAMFFILFVACEAMLPVCSFVTYASGEMASKDINLQPGFMDDRYYSKLVNANLGEDYGIRVLTEEVPKLGEKEVLNIYKRNAQYNYLYSKAEGRYPIELGDVIKVKLYAASSGTGLQIKPSTWENGKNATSYQLTNNETTYRESDGELAISKLKTIDANTISGSFSDLICKTNGVWREINFLYEEQVNTLYRAVSFMGDYKSGDFSEIPGGGYKLADIIVNKVDLNDPVLNSSFEKAMFEDWGWIEVNNDIFTQEVENEEYGTSLKITSNKGVGDNSIRQNVAVIENEKYVLSFKSKNPDGGKVKIQVLDRYGNELLTETVAKSDEWIETVSVPFEVPPVPRKSESEDPRYNQVLKRWSDKTFVTLKITVESQENGIVQYLDDVQLLGKKMYTNVEIDQENRSVTVSGVLKEGNENRDIEVILLNTNKTVDDLRENIEDTPEGVIFDYAVVTTDTEGNYSCTFDVTDTAEYKSTFTAVVRNIIGYSRPYILRKFDYYNLQFSDQLLERINNAATIDEIAAIIESGGEISNMEILGIDDLEIFTSIPVDERDFIYEYLLNSNGFGSIALLRNAVIQASILNMLNDEKADIDKIQEAINKYSENMGINGYAAFTKTYKNAADAVKKKIIHGLLAGEDFKYSDVSTFVYKFNDETIKVTVDNAVNYSEVIKILKDNSGYLNIDFSRFNSLSESNQNTVTKAVANYVKNGGDLTSVNDFLEDKIDKILKTPTPGTNPGRGGGAGSSSPSIVTVVSETGTTTSLYNNNPSSNPIFIDVDDMHWAADSIYHLVKLGVVKGYGDNTFRPDADITREEFVKMLVEAFGILDNTAESSFADVHKNEWYYPYISTLSKLGVVQGDNNNVFGIQREITRQDMAVLSYRLILKLNKTILPKVDKIQFIDQDKIAQYAVEAVSIMQQANIINGLGDMSFAPESYATRAQAAKIIHALLGLN